MTQPPAGWYEDPDGALRWWDGARWTEHTQPPPGQAAPTQQPWPAYAAGPAGMPPGSPSGLPPGPPPGRRRVSPALVLGIGGGLLALIVAAIVIVLVVHDNGSVSADDPLTPSARPATASPSATASAVPTDPFSDDPFSEDPSTPTPSSAKGWPSELPTDAPHDYPRRKDAVDAPTNASVKEFCKAAHLILDLPDGDTNAYYAWFWYRISVGTPSDMSAAAREGWLEDVAVDVDMRKKKYDAYEDYQIDNCY